MPTFDELLEQILVLLQREGRVTYRALKRRLGLDDDYLADLCGEIIEAKRLAVDEDGKVLVWVGAAQDAGATSQAASARFLPSSPQSPASYTPPHLAERIRAEQAAMESRGATDGERKTITALFADIKGSMELIEDLDPEEARDVIDPALQLMMEAVHRYEGYVVRITAQLVDAPTGLHIWADRYDRPLKDIFALQDEIVQKIATTLKLQLTLREQGYLVRKTTDNLDAYDYFLRGLESNNRATQEANTQARQMFEKAIELDPQYAEAYARLSGTRSREWIFQWVQDPQILEQALALAQKTVALDDSLPGAHEALGYVYLYKRQHEQAIAAAERAIALAPNDAEGSGWFGLVLNFAGRPEEAMGLIKTAMRLNPRYPFAYLSWLGMAYRLTGRYEEAIAALKTAVTRNPDFLPPHLHLAVGYSEVGRDEEARAEVAELRRISPNFSLEGLRRVMPFKDPAELERYLAALRKAGLQ